MNSAEPGLLEIFNDAPTETQVAFAFSLTKKVLAILDRAESGQLTASLMTLVEHDIPNGCD